MEMRTGRSGSLGRRLSWRACTSSGESVGGVAVKVVPVPWAHQQVQQRRMCRSPIDDMFDIYRIIIIK